MEDNLQEIILDNRNLIYSIVHRFGGNDFEDMYQAGCLGLINAYKNFKSEYNVKFTTYAYPFIVGEIYKFIASNKSIRLNSDIMKLSNKIKKAEEVLTNHLGKSPTDSELASFLEIDLYKLYEIRSISKVDSLDYEYENNNLYDFLFKDEVSIDKLIDLKNALSNLTKNEKDLIKNRYFNNLTQSDLAKLNHTNQVKVSREEKKVLTKLKAKMY